ncbi:Rab geranylgeranyltransferase [Lambiella insularis]|nr:Rab geranylgeranyltransferase [Lambiella insularis]
MASHGVPRVTDAISGGEEELKKIDHYKELVNLVQAKVYNLLVEPCCFTSLTLIQIKERQYTREVLLLTSKLLIFNPEYYTIWNHRRRILQNLFSLAKSSQAISETNSELDQVHACSKSILDLITEDLHFGFSLLRKFPKCYWIWNHRRWVLRQASTYLTIAEARSFWDGELSLVGKMLTLDNRNFHGWGYRRIVVAALESKELNESATAKSMVKGEFDYTTRMIGTSMSNFSAWHNRSKLIPRLLDELNASDAERRQLLNDELTWIQEGLYTDSHDQSLWFYHRTLMCTFDPTFTSRSMAPNLKVQDRLQYIESEIEKLVEMLEDDEDCKWIYQSLIQLNILYRDITGSWDPRSAALQTWMISLKRLDPLRQERWVDLEKRMNNS